MNAAYCWIAVCRPLPKDELRDLVSTMLCPKADLDPGHAPIEPHDGDNDLMG